MNTGSDEKIWNLASWIPHIVLLGVLWLVTSLPIITIGASTTALYSCIFQFRQDHHKKLIPLYFEQFKFHFKQATIIWMILLAASLILGIDVFYCIQRNDEMMFVICGTASAVLLTFTLLILMNVFAYLSKFENSIKDTMMKSLTYAFKDIFRTTLNAVLLISITFLVITIFPQFILIYGGVICFILSINFEIMFSKNIPGGRGSKRF
ncbi:MAG: YesL family protein [Erysipelotrichaceae bacterium]|nr:YesL family protein [Erysipelotrichaceae bacterium]